GLRVARARRIFSADRLGGILNYSNLEMPGNFEDGIHLAAKAEQMNRNDGADSVAFWRPRASVGLLAARFEVKFERSRRNIVGDRIDVDENRGGSDACDTTARREKRIVAREDGVPGAELHRHEDRKKRVRPGGNADGVGRTAITGDLLLERFDFRTKNEIMGGQHLIDRAPNRLSERRILFAEVEQRNPHGSDRMAVSSSRSNGKFGTALAPH